MMESKMVVAVVLLSLLAILPTGSWARDLADIRYRFTSCGASGFQGPSYKRCTKFYTDINSPIAQDGLLLKSDSFKGAQEFQVPRSGLYNITIAGAAGGRGLCNTEYGLGRILKLQVEIQSSDYVLRVAVGQRGLGPCDIDARPFVCNNPPVSTNDTAECLMQWHEWLVSALENRNQKYPFVGGAGGGGASMVWPVGKVNETLPIAIAGGGGGSPANLSYESVRNLNFTAVSTIDEELYREFMNAKDNYLDLRISALSGVRGYRSAPASDENINAGAGGGFLAIPERPITELDGKLLSSSDSFAQGGFDCARLFGDVPIAGVYGGFGSGGGGCGGGGGGGGYTGGAVLERGLDVPGGGGYSFVFKDIFVSSLGSSLNTAQDGYVDIVPADCGCAYQCDLDEITEQFECLCPNGTEIMLAPDLSDCFQAIELELVQGPWTQTNPDGFYFSSFTFNQTFIFSINATLRITTSDSAGPAYRRDTCAILLIGRDIVLVSNPVRSYGTVNALATVTVFEEQEAKQEEVGRENERITVSELKDFLNSSVLVTGAILVGTQPCTIEGMRMSVNASIKQPSAEPPEFSETLEIITSNYSSAFAEDVLQLVQSAVPSPTLNTDTSSTTYTSTHIIAIAVAIPLAVLGALMLILVLSCLWYRIHYRQRKKITSSLQVEIFDSSNIDVLNQQPASKSITIPEPHPDREVDLGYEKLYEVVRHDNQNVSGSSVPHRAQKRKFASKYGVSAPLHDFSKYNKQRTNSNAHKWEYPRYNLIYMRELGEGQFGKVLLMKTKGIAGYEGQIPVAVKTLTSTDPEVVRRFMEEAELMKKFCHPNIVSLLGITAQESDEDSAPLLIMEYMPYGSLQGFLQSHSPQENEESAITETDFYSFVIDVARAMEFLAMNGYVHRDVAARNCLVGSGLKIKIADFGLTRGVYNKDYYKVGGRTVMPVRWMAPEYLLYGVFTIASDVWSYGVLMWEIVMYGEMPLEEMEVRDILEKADNGTLQHPRPNDCPDIIYDVMCRCHNQQQDQRPTFTEIRAIFENTVEPSDSSIQI